MAIELPPVPSGSAALTDKEGRATRPLQSFLNAIRAAFAEAVNSLLPIHLTDANTVEQYNSTTAQALYVYNTRTSATNYERLGVAWASNIVTINAEIGSGGGTQRNLGLQTLGGRVGIGTGAPERPFHIKTTTAASPAIKLADGNNHKWTWGQGWTSATDTFCYIYDEANGFPSILFKQTGECGIGMYPPTANLHLKTGSATAGTAPLKFTAGTVNTTAEIGAVEYDGANYWGTSAGPSRYSFPRTIFTATADKTVANTTTETSLFGTGVGTLTLPANFFVAGRTIRARVRGYVSDTGSPTMQARVKLGAVVIASVTSGAIIATGTRPFVVEAVLTCRTTGATGAFIGQIYEQYGSTGGADYSVTSATVAVDTTASNALDVMLTWSAADALNTATITNATVEVLN